MLLKIVNEAEILIRHNRTIEDLEKDFPNEIDKLKEGLKASISENDPKILKLEFTDKRNYLSKKLTYPYEYFRSLDVYE